MTPQEKAHAWKRCAALPTAEQRRHEAARLIAYGGAWSAKRWDGVGSPR